MQNNNFSRINPFLKHGAIQKIIGKCPLCDFQYKNLNIKIIEENEEAQLMYIKCQKCQGSVIILIVSSGPLINSVGLITDLNDEDIIKFKNISQLKEGDVLNLHQSLKSNDFCINLKNNLKNNIWKKNCN